MKSLLQLIENTQPIQVIGNSNTSVSEIVFDSRKVRQNTLFVAQKGVAVDGHLYIEKAIELGAHVIVCENIPAVILPHITYIQYQNAAVAMAQMAANFYDNPSQKLQLVGITGTNGKTTVATLLHQLFSKAGFQVGLLSTVVIKVGKQEFPATHTTPDSVSLNYYLDKMVQEGCKYCFMEVSSHGIHQNRTYGLHFAGGVFTNLSHDHLDYHSTFAEYRDVKKSFFDNLGKKAFAISNIDDKNGSIMLQNTKAEKQTYALKTYAHFSAQIIENQLSGLQLRINNKEVWVSLIGAFNAYNVLAIYAVATSLGIEPDEALRLISQLESVSGRFQYTEINGITAIIDYAHTPDALENVLQTINEVRLPKSKLITVVGCGGNRDKEKRPIMAALAAENSDIAIFTADNPRFENPITIIEEMEVGVSVMHKAKTNAITDRKQAIRTACMLANSGDVILVAGKGHENYQEINGEKFPFDDLKITREFLQEKIF